MATLASIYGSPSNVAPQGVSQAASPSNNTAPAAAAQSMPNHAVSVSWLGLLVALILLRVIYEVSE